MLEAASVQTQQHRDAVPRLCPGALTASIPCLAEEPVAQRVGFVCMFRVEYIEDSWRDVLKDVLGFVADEL